MDSLWIHCGFVNINATKNLTARAATTLGSPAEAFKGDVTGLRLAFDLGEFGLELVVELFLTDGVGVGGAADGKIGLGGVKTEVTTNLVELVELVATDIGFIALHVVSGHFGAAALAVHIGLETGGVKVNVGHVHGAEVVLNEDTVHGKGAAFDFGVEGVGVNEAAEIVLALPVGAHHLFGVLETGGLDLVGPSLFDLTGTEGAIEGDHSVLWEKIVLMY